MRSVFLILAYPIVTHIGVVTNQPWLIWAIFGLIFFWVLWTIQYKSPAIKLLSVVSGTLIFAGLLVVAMDQFTVFYFPPILISASLLLFFGKSLLSGATPLITQFATMVHGVLDKRLANYTRIVTIVWTVFFAAMTLETILLALYGPIETWSLYTNFVNYGLVLVIFVVEYRIRVHMFTDIKHQGFIGFMKTLVKTDLKRL